MEISQGIAERRRRKEWESAFTERGIVGDDGWLDREAQGLEEILEQEGSFFIFPLFKSCLMQA